jgi:branched-chain amino acid transport system substrate-binding protein
MTAFHFKKMLTAVLTILLFVVSPAAAAAANSIRVGGNIEMSGEYGHYGDIVVKGARLAFEEANAAGGVRGQPIDFFVLDNASDDAKAVVVMKSLAAGGKVAAVLGCLSNTASAAAYKSAEQSRIPLVSPSAANPHNIVDKGQVNRFAFRTCLDDPYQAVIMARFAVDELAAKTAAIIINGKSAYSKDLAAAFEQAFLAAGGKIVAKETLAQPKSDYDQASMTASSTGGADVIFMPLGAREAANSIRQLRAAGVRVPILGSDYFDSAHLIAYAGEEVLNNIYYCHPYATSPKLSKVTRFYETFEKKYKIPASPLAVMGYEAALVIIEALRKAGTSSPEAVQAALEGLTVIGLLGPLTIGADHNVTRPAVVMRMIDGQGIPYRLFEP